MFISHLLLVNFTYCQVLKFDNEANKFSLNLECTLGKTSPPNFNFPQLDAQQSLLIAVFKSATQQFEWEKQLDFPSTGIELSYSNFGNNAVLGHAFSIMPFIEMNIFKKYSDNFSTKSGLGLSYFSNDYDSITNPFNKAISTKFTWAFRFGLYYKFFRNKKFSTKLGLVYFHNSNGHMRLPNNGLNTFAISLSSQINFSRKFNTFRNSPTLKPIDKTGQKFYNFRFGIGQKVFSRNSINLNEVFIITASKGMIINKTFKIGYGFCYRFYEDYFNLNKNEKLFQDNIAVLNASNFALSGNAELLMNHIGVELEFGINLYKPTYKDEFLKNEGKFKNGIYQKPELDWYYYLKKTITSRLGLKYYVLNNNNTPKNNFYVGTFINANFGQADFNECSFGFIHCFDKK